MNELLDDLLELSRVGRVVNDFENVSFRGLVEVAVESCAATIAETGVKICIADQLPDLFGDRVRLLEVVQNLVDNAVKFTAGRKNPQIQIGAHREGNEMVCYVRDNGIGIEPNFRMKIFDLFEKLDGKSPGNGVGLAIVKRIIEVHGGRIWVESDGLDTGSTFCFTTPKDESANEPTAESVPTEKVY